MTVRLTMLIATAGLLAFAAPAGALEDVDPFIGTAATGHTFPAAACPFGLVQAGPDTGNRDWQHCAGYRYDEGRIIGFSQTHLNGTGCGDLGDLSLLPFRGDRMEPSAFDHSDERATPGYYAVTLKEAAVRVEIAASPHSAIYRFSGEGRLRLLVDCDHRIGWGSITRSDVTREGMVALAGTNRSESWVARDYAFALRFSREALAVSELPKAKGQVAPQLVYDFDLTGSSPLLVKLALSAEGGVAAARANLASEIPAWDFEGVRTAAANRWQALFDRVRVEGPEDRRRSFYTSLYHLFLQPNDLADVGGASFYSTFSCWDTFRAAHPLYTLVTPERVPGFVDSMLKQGKRTGFLPIWTLWGADNQCMIGTHSIPVIVDAVFKGLLPPGTDENAVFEQIRETLVAKHPGRAKENWDLYDRYGYYPFDLIKGESVSRTLECAYDDACAARFAERLGRKDDAAFFRKRAASWKNVFDPALALVRGRDTQGNWREPYNPYALGTGAGKANDFTEGNAFQYTWHVMQDPEGLVAAMGGREKFVAKLDSLFTMTSKGEGQGEVLDVTGLIGQYVHGNEPSHHVIYFYPLVGQPGKAAARIREVFDRFYLAKPDGLCGNDDCGQMSAWYVFSAMGFYPFDPCGGEYVLGAPQVPKVTLRLPGGKTLTVTAANLSEANRFVRRVTFRETGAATSRVLGAKIRHEELLRGGELVFEMTDRDEGAKL